MDLTITVCDVDLVQGRDTKRYTLQQGDRRVTVDLCEEHAGPIEALLEGRAQAPNVPVAAPQPEHQEKAKSAEEQTKPTTKKRATRRRRSSKVVSLEEIEASKRA